MALNCAWNHIFFRRCDLRLAFLYYIPYLLLVVLAVWSAARVDAPAALGYRWWRPAEQQTVGASSGRPGLLIH